MSIDPVILDIRPVPPPEKHPTIFRTFDALPRDGAMELINDHDPKPLYYQFGFERVGQFAWQYLEVGPATWRVLIRKIA